MTPISAVPSCTTTTTTTTTMTMTTTPTTTTITTTTTTTTTTTKTTTTRNKQSLRPRPSFLSLPYSRNLDCGPVRCCDPPPCNNHCANSLLCFFLIVETYTGAPLVVLPPPLPNNPSTNLDCGPVGCCTPPQQRHIPLSRHIS